MYFIIFQNISIININFIYIYIKININNLKDV